jgi:hypothetical protein
VVYAFQPGHGGYLYVLEGGPVMLGAEPLPALAAAEIAVTALEAAELLLVDVLTA